MQFQVRALTADSTVARLSVDALDEAAARRQVEARGLFVSTIQRRGGGRAMGAISLVLFSQELLAPRPAGLGVVEALEALLEKDANLALAKQADRFPPRYIGLVKAAKGTSDLPRSLGRDIDTSGHRHLGGTTEVVRHTARGRRRRSRSGTLMSAPSASKITSTCRSGVSPPAG